MVDRRIASAARRRPARAAALGVALAASLALSACGGGDDPDDASPATPVAPADGRLTVLAFEWGFDPESIVIQEGKEVTFAFENDGDILHNLKVEDQPEAEVVESESGGPLSADEGELFVGAEAGGRGSLTFVALEPGTYTFFCTIQGHRALGMEGTLIIE